MSSATVFVDVALRGWKGNVDRAGKFFGGLSDEELLREVAPGKNRLIYLWGHLAATHDAMLPMLGLGERLHPELDALFVKNPDKALSAPPTGAELKRIWEEIDAALAAGFATLTAEQWLERHTAVSAEDFVKEPHRNRFAMLTGRTVHLAYHFGQAILAKRA